MNESKDKALKKKLLLDYLLSQLFDNSSDLIQMLDKIENDKRNDDPFIEKPEIKVEQEPKPLKFLSKNDGERFKALKNKALSREKQEPTEVEDLNAETEC